MRRHFFVIIGILYLQLGFAQTGKITGTVIDLRDNSPLGNATVKIKGGATTSTSTDGTFSIATTKNDVVLEITSIGFTKQTVKASVGEKINIPLQVDVKGMSEIVITGVGVATSKRKLGISVESITADKLPPAPQASIDQALIGKIPGAQISSTSGSLGANVAILLRGINTLNRGTSPMILLDGLEVGSTNLNSLDLNIIERVEVVQGSAAATIYGAQGANGVIQLFTKKGKPGQLNIDISSSITSNDYLNIGGLRKAKFHGYETNANNEVIGGSSGEPLVFDPVVGKYTENLVYNSTDPATQLNKPYDKNLKYYDHYKEFFQAAPTYNNSVSISGGKEKLDFSFSASNNHQESNIKRNGYLERSNFTSNVGIEIAKNLKFRTTTQLVYTKNTTTLYDRTVIYSINNTRAFVNYELQDSLGNYSANYGDAAGVNGSNPNYELQYHRKNDIKVDVLQSFNLNYKFNRFVELDAKYGLNYNRRDVKDLYKNQTGNVNINTFSPVDDAYHTFGNDVPITGDIKRYLNGNTLDYTGELDLYNFNNVFQNFIATATIRTDFEKDFHVKLPIKTSTQIAFDYRNRRNRNFYTYGYGVPTYEPYTSRQVDDITVIKDEVVPFITYGYLINQRFEFGDFAGISGGFRSDYSSAYGQGSKPFTFPRGDAFLRLSQLNFWNNGRLGQIFPEFKLRAAYGKAGIQPTSFQRIITLETTPLGDNTAFYFNPVQPNPQLGVEISKEFEIGTDISVNLLKNSWLKSANLSFTYWDRSTDNAIYEVSQAPTSGLGTLFDNAFGLGSNGIQASLNLEVLSTKKFSWNFSTNFGKQTSKITGITGPEVIVLSAAGSSNYVLKVNEKVGQLFGYLGLHDVNELGPDGNPFIPKDEQGDYTVASNGWVVNKATKQPYFTPNQYSFGDPNPKFNMSFINDFTYKNIVNFSFQWDWIYGSHLYNQTKEWMYRDGIHSDYEKVINIDGQVGAWTAFYRGVYAQRSRNGTKSYFYENSSFFRLRNVDIAVDLAKIFSIKPFKRLQLVLAGRNLITATKYTGMDPEVSSGNTTGNSNSAFDRGVDHNTLPNLKSYSAGVNIGF